MMKGTGKDWEEEQYGAEYDEDLKRWKQIQKYINQYCFKTTRSRTLLAKINEDIDNF